ncbi:MAG: DUF5690 family protein [Bacteroidota bacterium]
MVNVKERLEKASPFWFTLFTVFAAFGTYFCMYSLRKPFTVATFEDMTFMGVDYKIWLITIQVLGYMLSKFIGIKVISEMKASWRVFWMLILAGVAGLSLLLFAITPAPYNIIWMFFNGLPLGMIWGLVFGYLEGRKNTEILGAGLCVSFIVSSGVVKSVGKYVMLHWGVTEFWMPFVTAMIFIIPLVVSVWMLSQIPPPTAEDERLRTKRRPMNRAERISFIKEFGLGLVLLITVYVLLTAFRDFRDNFAAEIWQTLGYGDSPSIFTATEVPVSLGVLLVIGLTVLIKDNMRALIINHLIILVGLVMVAVSTFAFQQGWIGAPLWMILEGLGLYLGYVLYNSVFFERIIAAFKYVSNVGFLIYLADSFGYMGSVGVLLYKNFGQAELSWLSFFEISSYVMAGVGILFTTASLVYFYFKEKNWTLTQEAVETA